MAVIAAKSVDADASEEVDAFGQAFDALRGPGASTVNTAGLHMNTVIASSGDHSNVSQAVDPFGAAPFNKAIGTFHYVLNITASLALWHTRFELCCR